MAVKYVKDFQFDKSFGYTGSAGTGPVSNNERAMGQPVKRRFDDSLPPASAVFDKKPRIAEDKLPPASEAFNKKPRITEDRLPPASRAFTDSEPTPAEIVKMRQAREYMKEDKATSDAAKREMGFKKGGKVLEKATGETYPSRKAMVKHEKTETPRMQKEEVVQKQVVRGPAMAAGRDPRIPMFKCGGKAKK